jgi:hypothetical protein
MDQPLPVKLRLFVFWLGIYLLMPLTISAQWDPDWFTCPDVSTTKCESTVPSIFIDLSDDPDRKWYSCKIGRGPQQDTCCGFPPAQNTERCIEFKILLHPDAEAILFEIPESNEPEWQQDKLHPNAPSSPGAKPSVNTYRINCSPTLYGGAQGDDPACLTSTILQDTVFITYCQPGGNENVYRIKSIKGNINGGNLIVQQGQCGGSVSVNTTNIDLSTLTWTSTQHSSYNSFLSSQTGSSVTVTVPNGANLTYARYVAGVPYLDYQVCGYPIGWDNCNGINQVCAIASIAVITPPSITVTDLNVCPEDPYYVEVTHSSRNLFDYWWYNGPNGTGTLVASGNGVYSHTFTTAGAKSVVYRDPTVAALGLDPNCTRDTQNINIILYPLPNANISGPTVPLCTNVPYAFSTPSVSGATYFWQFYEYPAGTSITTSTSRTPNITFTTCGDKRVRLTVTSSQGCDSIVTRVFQADSLPPNLTGCNLPSPTVECGGTAQNNANITTWHNDNLAMLDNPPLPSCVTDNCAWTVTSDFNLDNFTPGPCGSESTSGSITVTYTVSDGCFQSQISATYTITDNTPPVVNDPDLADMSFDCVLSIPDPETNITLVEACGTASFTHIGDTPAGDPCGGFVITRTYRLVDACGNTTDYQQHFTLNDNQNPVITCPNQISAESCGRENLQSVSGLAFSANPSVISVATFLNLPPGNQAVSDNCGVESITYQDVQTGTCPASFVRTFVVTDSCGNTAQCSQNIIITDNTPPIVNCVVSNLELQCDHDYETEIQQWLTQTQNAILNSAGTNDPCGDVLTISNDWNSGTPLNLSCDLSSGVTVTFTVSDSCGNSVQCTGDIIIYDDIPPSINCNLLTGGTVECYSDLRDLITIDSFLLLSGPVVTDNCAMNFTVDVSGIPAFDNCPDPNIPITYSVTDQCGNTSTCIINYAINNSPPVVTCPPPVSFECYTDLIQEVANDSLYLTTSGVSVACGMSYSVAVGVIPSIGNCPDDVTVTFTVTDSCGRSNSCNVTYTFVQVAPVITCPGSISIEACGSEDLASQTGLAYSPNQTDITVNQFENLSPGNPQVSDNCGIQRLYYYDVQTGTCPATFIRTFVVLDSCGNTDDCSQSITIADNTPPVVDCVVSDLYLDCAADIQAEITSWITQTQTDILTSSGTTDPCGDVLSITNDWNPNNVPVLNSCNPASGGIQITFTVTDSCGNPSTCTGNVYLQDTIAPTINCSNLPGGTFGCFNELIAQIRADSLTMTNEVGGIVSDDCWDDFTISVSGIPSPGNCPIPNIPVTYTITDPCGNSSNCIVNYILDNTGPSIICPPDVTVSCYSDLVLRISSDSLALLSGGITVSCGMPYQVSHSLLPSFDDCPETYTITWTVSDSCGRTANCSTTYTINNSGPAITCFADTTVTCYEEIQAIVDANVLAHNGGTNVMIACDLTWNVTAAVDPKIDNCTPSYEVVYTITDQCGRSANCMQVFTIDNAAPVIDCFADTAVTCYEDIQAIVDANIALHNGGTNVTIACDLTWNVTAAVDPKIDNCTPSYEVVYTITDQCGRSANCMQVFTIDNAAPVIDCFADTTVTCYEEIQAIVDANVLAHNGGTNVTIACDLTWNVTAVVDPKVDNCTPSYNVIYTITDQCGRSASCIQVFTIVNAAPTITCFADTTVTCYEDIQAIVDANVLAHNGGTNVTIACDLTWNVTASVDPKIDNCTPSYEVVYTITDQCGRSANCIQVFTIDNAAPTITCFADTTVTCYEDIQAIVDANIALHNGGTNVTIACDLTWNVTAAVDPKIDNCTPSYEVVYTITDQCGRSA